MPSTKTPDYLLVLVEKKTNYGDRWFSTDSDVIQPVWVLITVYTEIVEYEISNMIFNIAQYFQPKFQRAWSRLFMKLNGSDPT